MSRLGELIRTLCPDGVEYKPMGEVASINRGVRVVKRQLVEKGKYPVYQNSLTPLGFYDNSNCSANTAFVICGGAAGDIGYSDKEFWAADDCFYMGCSSLLNDKYLYYVLLVNQNYIRSQVRKASIPRLSRTVLEKLQIPVPPMEVQEEIVRILDKFTALEAELEAELEARKKQYEHYRDNLLTFSGMGGVSYRRLKEIVVKYSDGMHTLPNTINDKGGYPILSAQNINNGQIDLNTLKYVSKEVFDVENRRTDVKKGDVLLTIVGAVGRVAVVNFDLQALFQRSVCVIRPNIKIVNAKFMKHIIETSEVQKYIYANAHGAVQKGIYLKQIGEIEIPIPPIEEQERIVGFLDKFEAICTDLCEGLPAEIEARRRQYEHYRDRLLTFRRKSA